MKNNPQTIIWKGIGKNYQTTEELSLDPGSDPNYIKVKSSITGIRNGQAILIDYSIILTKNWKVKSVSIVSQMEEREELNLKSDLNGNWFNGQNEKLDHLKGCIDIDISASPFTNSLPINRLGNDLLERKYLKMLFIDMDSWQLRKVEQAYSKLEDGKYMYEGISSKFRSEIYVDSKGLVTEYPDMFQIVKPVKTFLD